MPADVTLNSGSGGAIIATDPTTSSEHYQLIKLAQGAVGTFTLVTTANALPVVVGSSFPGGIVSLSSTPTVTATVGTNPWSSAPGFNVPVVSVSSGIIQLSSQLTVTATGPVTVTSGLISVTSGTITLSSATSLSSGIVTLSSVPTIFSASSGGIQAFIPISPTSSVAGAGFGPVTSSAGVLASLSSGTVSLSSQITVTATGPVTITSGTVTLSSIHTVTATAGTNPWSSAPGFNVPVVSVSSGLIQLSSQISVTATAGTNPWSSAPGFNIPVVTVSSGPVQALQSGTWTLQTTAGTAIATSSALGLPNYFAVTPTSSIAGAAIAPITSSAGQLVNLSSGTVTLSSAPLVIVASSGGTQTVIMSSVQTVTATAATNPWSSAPGFNVPVVSVSSGLVQVLTVPAVSTVGLRSYSAWSTGAVVVTNITTAQTILAGWAIYNSTAAIRGAKVYNTTAPTAGSTAGLIVPVTIPGSTGGGGSNLSLAPLGVFTSNGLSMIITSNPNATDTGTAGANDVAWTLFYV